MKLRRTGSIRDARDTILFVLIALAIGWAVSGFSFIVNLENHLLFQMPFRPRPKRSNAAAIVWIDDANSIAQFRGSPARNVAALVNALADYKVAAIGLDMLFRDEWFVPGLIRGTRVFPVGQDDEALAQAFSKEGHVYLISLPSFARTGSHFEIDHNAVTLKVVHSPLNRAGVMTRRFFYPWWSADVMAILSGNGYLGSLPRLAGTARGVSTTYVFGDGIASVSSSFRVVDKQIYLASLPIALASVYLGDTQPTLTLDSRNWVEGVTVGKVHLRTNSMGLILVNVRNPDFFGKFSAADIVNHKVRPDDLQGKVVLVSSNYDQPLSTYAGNVLPVEILCSSLEDIVSGNQIRWHSTPEAFALFIIFVLLTGGVSAWTVSRPSRTLLAWMIGGALLIASIAYVIAVCELRFRGVVINFGYATTLFVLSYLAATNTVAMRRRRERWVLRSAFEHYLDPKVIETVVNDPVGLELGGSKRHLSVLFADIVEFTARAEATSPEALVEMLNEFMSVMTEIVIDRGGVVDKIVGDSIMAFWGAPVAAENPARMAVECGLEMLSQLRRLRDRDARFADIAMGVGIATGDAIVGNLGGKRRFDYSVVGDTVNLAARLESLTRQLGVSFLVNQQTFTEAGGTYVARGIGLVRVKGKAQPVDVVEILGWVGDADETYCAAFTEALSKAHQGAWAEALQLLKRYIELRPEDVAGRLYHDLLNAREATDANDLILEFSTK